MQSITRLSLFWILILFSKVALAQDLTFEMTFLKKPPSVALIYAVDGTTDAIAQTDIDQVNKEFDSSIYVVTPDTKVQYKNSDEIDHNIYSKVKGDWSGFDIGLLPPGASVNSETDFPTGSMVRLRCKIHPKMRAYVAEIPTNVYQVLELKKNGLEPSYTLTVPSDTTKVGLIMAGYETMEFDISSGTISEKLLKKGKERGQLTITKK